MTGKVTGAGRMSIPLLALVFALLLAKPTLAQFANAGYYVDATVSYGGGAYGAASYGDIYGILTGILPPIEGIGRKLLTASEQKLLKQSRPYGMAGRSLLQVYGMGYGTYGAQYYGGYMNSPSYGK